MNHDCLVLNSAALEVSDTPMIMPRTYHNRSPVRVTHKETKQNSVSYE